MIFKILLVAALYAFALGYPLQEGCECECCSPQEDPTTTTAATMAPDEPHCCDCCPSPTQTEPPTATTTTPAPEPLCCDCCPPPTQTEPPTTTTTTPAPEPLCCDCCPPPTQTEPPTTTTTTPAPEPLRCDCCPPPIQAEPPTTTTTPAPEPPCCYGCPSSYQADPPTTTESLRDQGGQVLATPKPEPSIGPKLLKCPPGYKRIAMSCYYVEKEQMVFYQAAMNCADMGAQLFVPQDISEWNEVMALAPPNFWTWTGLVKKGESQNPEWNGMVQSMDASLVPWLVKPYSPLANGWTEFSKCAAYYNVGVDSSSYVYFYLCGSSFYSICETGLVQ